MKKSILIIISLIFFSYSAFSEDNSRFNWSNFGYFSKFTTNAVSYNPVNKLLYKICTSNLNFKNETWYVFYCSSDSGNTWNVKNEFNSKGLEINTNSFIINNSGEMFFISLDAMKIYKTTNEGVSFKKIFTCKSNCKIIDYKFDSKNNFYVFDDNKNIYWSENHFNIWTDTKMDFEIRSSLIDSKDDIYIISQPVRTYLYPDRIHFNLKDLNSSDNALYKLDKITKTINLIVENEYNKHVFIQLGESSKGIYILSAKEDYHQDMEFDTSYTSISDFRLNKLDSNFNLINSTKINIDDFLDINIYGYNATLESIPYPCAMVFNNYDELFILTYFPIPYSYNSKSYWYKIDTNLDFKVLSKKEFNYSRATMNNFNLVINSPFIYLNTPYSFTFISVDNGNNWTSTENDELYIGFAKSYQKKDSTIITYFNNNLYHYKTNLKPILLYTNSNHLNITSLNETKSGKIVAGTTNDGILLLNDSSIFENKNKGLKNLSISNICDYNGNLLVFTQKGIYITYDECESFQFLYNESCKEVITSKNNVFFVSMDGKLYDLIFENNQLIEVRRLLSKYFITSLSINNANCMIAGTISNGVLKSNNLGLSWTPANNGFISPKVYQIISTNQNEFIALAQTGIFYSNDNGENWEKDYYNYGSVKNTFIVNPDDKLKLNKLRFGKIFSSYNYFLNGINSDTLRRQSGWETFNGYKRQNYENNYENNIRFSKDGSFFYTSSIIDVSVPNYFYIIDYNTGKIIEEWLLPNQNIRNNEKILGINEKGKVIFYNTFSSTLDSNCIYQYDVKTNIYSDTLTIDISGNKTIKHYGYNSDSNRIYLIYYDGKNQFRIYENKNLLYQKDLIYDFLGLRAISKDLSLVLYSDNNNFHYILDVNRNITNKVDLSGTALTSFYNKYTITDDNRWLIIKSEFTSDSTYIFDLTELKTSEILKYKYSTNSLSNNLLYLGKSEFLSINSLAGLTGVYIQKFDALTNKILTISSKYDKIADGPKVLARDSMSFLVSGKIIQRFDLKDIEFIYNKIPLVDFYSPKTIYRANDTVTFIADSIMYLSNYNWDFGDGTKGYGQIVKHVYNRDFFTIGDYTIKLYYNYKNVLDSVIKKDYIRVDFPGGVESNESYNDTSIIIYPNPARDLLNVKYNISELMECRISLIDETGNELNLLSQGKIPVGEYKLSIYPEKLNLKNGTYYLIFDFGTVKKLRKFVILK